MRRELYAESLELARPPEIRNCALNLSSSFINMGHHAEVKSLLRDQLPGSRDSEIHIKLRSNYAMALRDDAGSSHDDVVEAVAIFRELLGISQRVLGNFHPETINVYEWG